VTTDHEYETRIGYCNDGACIDLGIASCNPQHLPQSALSTDSTRMVRVSTPAAHVRASSYPRDGVAVAPPQLDTSTRQC
jgi:hypothetical protein